MASDDGSDDEDHEEAEDDLPPVVEYMPDTISVHERVPTPRIIVTKPPPTPPPTPPPHVHERARCFLFIRFYS